MYTRKDKVTQSNDFETYDIDRQYNIIKKRKLINDTIKNISLAFFVISLLLLVFAQFISVGNGNYNLLNLIINGSKETSVEAQIISALKPTYENLTLEGLCYIALYTAALYIITKLVILVFTLIFSFIKGIFGGFIRLFTKKELTYEEKLKVVEKYKKKHSHTIEKGVLRYIIKLVITFIFPPIATIMDIKEGATSFVLPLMFSIMFVLCLYLPLSSIGSSLIVLESPLKINMPLVFITTVCGVLHSLILIVLFFANLKFKFSKVK